MGKRKPIKMARDLRHERPLVDRHGRILAMQPRSPSAESSQSDAAEVVSLRLQVRDLELRVSRQNSLIQALENRVERLEAGAAVWKPFDDTVH